jgi:hypothetical protein
MMNEVVVAIGSFLLLLLSTGVGMLIASQQQRIRRLRLAKRSWELYRWEQDLLNLAELDGCPGCRLLRRRADLQHRPISSEAA